MTICRLRRPAPLSKNPRKSEKQKQNNTVHSRGGGARRLPFTEHQSWGYLGVPQTTRTNAQGAMSLVASRMYNVLQVQVLQVQVEQFKFEIIVEIGCAPLLARPYHREYRARCSAASDKLIHHIMLHRMGSRPSADAEHCTLSPQTAKDERGPTKFRSIT